MGLRSWAGIPGNGWHSIKSHWPMKSRLPPCNSNTRIGSSPGRINTMLADNVENLQHARHQRTPYLAAIMRPDGRACKKNTRLKKDLSYSIPVVFAITGSKSSDEHDVLALPWSGPGVEGWWAV
ncbi:hypothetical protein HYALB_00004119 [Hymenoscyphus albidus]|uniref:Uncharacterized protein n=1 Tax=Hymenoscyphus albidus TaxID=595503 RepID=A0A9N9LI39_9HELO|nr:hypothetical protein HYALB_00004119 [Hymenoscyphus albidus]